MQIRGNKPGLFMAKVNITLEKPLRETRYGCKCQLVCVGKTSRMI